jgi:anaerobic selenocysteine-containing dehydrogenase
VTVVHLSALDAADAGVSDGQLVQVTSATGSIVATAVVNDDIRRGAVSVPHGFADANVGVLTTTPTDIDPLTGMVLLVGVPVKVEPAAT